MTKRHNETVKTRRAGRAQRTARPSAATARTRFDAQPLRVQQLLMVTVRIMQKIDGGVGCAAVFVDPGETVTRA